MTDQAIEDTGAGEAAETTVEDRARDMGWRPKEEFKGDETRWVDAETFVKRGEEILPILKANSRKDREALEAAQAKIADMEQTFREFKQYHSKTEQRALDKARKELEREMSEAVEAKDHKAVREIAAEMADLSKDVRTDDSGNDLKKSQDEAFAVWVQDNGWFKTDAALRGAATAIAGELANEGLTDPAKQLAEVAKRVRAEFPQKFENERRRAPAAVEGATPNRKGGKTRADLPPDHRIQMDKWVKQGLLTEKQYLADYQW